MRHLNEVLIRTTKEQGDQVGIVSGNYYICLGYLGMGDVYVIVNDNKEVITVPDAWVVG